MARFLRKIVLIFMFSLFAFFSFSEDWYVCLGATDDLNEALTKKKIFEDNDIPIFVREFLDYSGVKTYRIFYSETLETKENALMFRNSLLEKEEITRLVKREGVWVTALPTKIEEKKVEHPVVQKEVEVAFKEPEPVVSMPEREPVVPVPEPESEPQMIVVKKSVKINIKDSDTGQSIEGVSVELDKERTFQTDSKGIALLPDDISSGAHALFVTKGDDYVPTHFAFNLGEKDISCELQFSIPKKVNYDRIKIVLDWGEKPYDLDAHVYGKMKHVSFTHKKSKNLELDRDDKDGFGPETITIRNPVANETYSYYVCNFSDNGKLNSNALSKSEAKVSVFFDNDFIRSFSIYPSRVGTWWHVFDIVNKNEIIVVDDVSNKRK